MKTYRKHMQACLAVFMTLFALSMGTTAVYAQTEEEAVVSSQQDELEVITGTVVDAATKEPIPGVRVEALGNNRYTAMTKADGCFTIKIPKEIVSFYVSTPGYDLSLIHI